MTIGLLICLSSCDYQSRADFEKEIAAEASNNVDIEMPKITYIADEGGSDTIDTPRERKEDDLDFIEMYGKGSLGRALDPADAKGNLIDTNVGDTQIGISLIPSVQRQGGYSSILSYMREGNLVEREFGPVAGVAGMSTTVTYDIIDSESGPMLLVSQVSVSEFETYSAYYLFNKFMGLVDYMVFRNSVDQTMPTVERLGDIIEWTDMAYPGDINLAVDRRMKTENKYLPSMFEIYSIKTRPLVALVGGREMDIGYLPNIKSERRILVAKTTDNPTNPGMFVDIEK